jgi:succinoglycan biosynthesis transport protein ExoP
MDNVPAMVVPRSLPAPRRITLGDRWQMMRRRRWPAIGTGLGVLLIAFAAALFWPPTFRSTGTILIEQQELPSDLVQSTITSYADQRIQEISQRVMTTDNLQRIIQRYDLYPKLRRNQPREVLLERMRKDIHFQMISADVMDPRQGRATKADIAFAVSYDSGSPDIAARVANELISLYLDENVKSRRQQAQDASQFLQSEAQRLDGTTKELQAKIAAFKDKHINTLPDQALLNNELLMRNQEELTEVDTQMRSLEQQSTYLDAQLAQISPSSQVYTSTGERVLSPADRLKFLRTEYARLSGIYAPDHPDVLRTKREIESLEKTVGQVDSSNDLQRQLEDARTQLAAARGRYGPDHPDVVRLERQVQTLTQALATNAGKQPATPTAVPNPDNPAYIEVKAQREASQSQIESLRQKRADLSAKLTNLEGRLAAAPAVERDYSAMLRELEADQLQYREVQQKLLEANLSQNLEDQQKGERFTLIDPPLAPQIPSTPNRILIAAVGFMLSLVAALGMVALLESNDSSVRDRRDLEALLQVAPLAVLPRIVTGAEIRSRRRRQALSLFGAVGAIILGLVLTHLLYRPLDVLWAVAMRKLGA